MGGIGLIVESLMLDVIGRNARTVSLVLLDTITNASVPTRDFTQTR